MYCHTPTQPHTYPCTHTRTHAHTYTHTHAHAGTHARARTHAPHAQHTDKRAQTLRHSSAASDRLSLYIADRARLYKFKICTGPGTCHLAWTALSRDRVHILGQCETTRIYGCLGRQSQQVRGSSVPEPYQQLLQIFCLMNNTDVPFCHGNLHLKTKRTHGDRM